MDRNAFVSDFYNKVSEVFLQNISDTQKESAKEAYLLYLHKSYDQLFADVEENDFDTAATVCVKKEKLIHFSLNETAKLAFLFPDKAFLELQELSFEIAEKAKAKKLGNEYVLDRSKEEYARLLESLNEKVSPSFKFSAERVLSEAAMDLSFLFDETTGQSFRTAII